MNLKEEKFVILIDNGHGKGVVGKKSPNGELKEWKYTRDVAKAVVEKLRQLGFTSELVVPEVDDIPLSERCDRVNSRIGRDNGKGLLVSIHLNAAGDGSKWAKATGWECYTSFGRTKSDKLAEHLYNAAEKELPGIKMRTDMSDGDKDKEARFYILDKTVCPAVLTENLFMDSREDYGVLMSQEGFDKIVNLHVNGIVEYLKEVEQ